MADVTVPELPQFKGKPGWEFTELSGLDLAAFAPAAAGEGDAGAAERAPSVLEAPAGAIALTQVDGRVVAAPGDLPAGVTVGALSDAVAGDARIAAQLGAIVREDQDVFTALNAAGWTGGAYVHVAQGVRVEQPIVLTAIADAAGVALHRRVLVVLEDGAEAEIWEQQLSGDGEAQTLVNAIVELRIGANARLRFVAAQDLNERSWVFGSQRAEVARDGQLDWVVVGFGAANGKVRTETLLAGEGAHAKVTGAYAPHARQHVDYDTTQEHGAPNTTSDLAFRGILTNRASAVWRGMIKVDPGAQKTDAFQECRNLLLSKRAHADAIPGLEILANDVRCTHAAAIAQVDPEQLFYLRSRGLPEPAAQRLVIEGFMAELVERFEAGAIRDAMSAALERRVSLLLD